MKDLSFSELPIMRPLRAVPLVAWRRAGLILLGILIVWWLSQLIWLVYNGVSYRVPAGTPAQNPVLARHTVDIEALVGSHLFGEANAPVAEKTEEVAESTVPLKLVGVYGAGDAPHASAIIEAPGGQQAVVFVGEAMPSNSGTLKQVFFDRIVFDRSGRLETLRMEDLTAQLAGMMNQGGDTADSGEGDEEDEDGNVIHHTSQMIDKRGDPYLGQQLRMLRSQLQTNPGKIADIVQIQPSQNGGYKISPGRDRKMFARFGLQNGDIVKAVNGVTLDDPSKAMGLMSQLQSATQLQLTLERGGQPINIVLSPDR